MLSQVFVATVMLAACWLLVKVFQSESLPALQRSEAARSPLPRLPDAAAWENEGGAPRERS